jgi:2'-5' RNA ligase
MKVESRYKANTGTYISVVPQKSSYGYLESLLRKFLKVQHGGRLAVPADMHCTVMYAPNSVLTAAQQLAVLSQAQAFKATAKALTVWRGADEDYYLVLELDSPDLARFHAKLAADFGLVPTFDDYRPHITLISGMSSGQEASYPVEPAELALTGLRIEDAK